MISFFAIRNELRIQTLENIAAVSDTIIVHQPRNDGSILHVLEQTHPFHYLRRTVFDNDIDIFSRYPILVKKINEKERGIIKMKLVVNGKKFKSEFPEIG